MAAEFAHESLPAAQFVRKTLIAGPFLGLAAMAPESLRLEDIIGICYQQGMSRPVKRRCIAHQPGANYFKPCGIPMFGLAEVILALDETEAIRLTDLEGLYQEEAAARMKISRQTFGNIIHAAHAKVAEAIIEGKALRIEGGTYRMTGRQKSACASCR